MPLAVRPQREQVRVASGLDMLAGLWLVLSAFVFRSSPELIWDLALIGGVVAILSGVRALGGYRPSWPSWVNAILGLWVLTSPWILGRVAYPDMLWNAVITGAVIIMLAIWSALATDVELENAGPH